MFHPDVSRAVAEAAHCRVAVYPATEDSPPRTQIEVSSHRETLGQTRWDHQAGHWHIVGISAEQAAAEASRLRGQPVCVHWDGKIIEMCA